MFTISSEINQSVADGVYIMLLSGQPFEMFVDCEMGGNYLIAQKLAKELEGHDVTARIRHAESAAAVISLACKRRVIEKNGVIVLHLGNVYLRGVDIMAGFFHRNFNLFEDLVLWQLVWLESNFPLLKDSPEMAELYTNNRVVISSERALELALVHEIV